jgi:Icc-related predicted phosphoesterase
MVPNQKSFIDQFLSPFFKRVLETASVQQIFFIPGNWDLGYPYLFKEPPEGIIDLNQRSYRLKNGYELIGYPFVPPTPFRPKDYEKMDDREAPWPPQKNPSYIRSSDQTDQLIPVDPYLYLRKRETIEEDLDQLTKPLHPKRTVYIMHSPPFGTRLDLIQGGKSAGSRSIKNFIEKNQPLLTLHGHIHESPELSGAYFDRIGETLMINPGQFIWTSRDIPNLHAGALVYAESYARRRNRPGCGIKSLVGWQFTLRVGGDGVPRLFHQRGGESLIPASQKREFRIMSYELGF